METIIMNADEIEIMNKAIEKHGDDFWRDDGNVTLIAELEEYLAIEGYKLKIEKL